MNSLKEGTVMRKLVSTVSAGVVAGIFLISAGAAVAQPAPKQPAKEVKTYDFSGDTLEGSLIKPDGTSVDVRDFGQHDSLIRIRKDFIAEILKSAEDL